MRPSKNKFQLVSILSFLLMLYNEVLVYWQAYLKWPQLHEQGLFNYKNGTRINNLDERPIRLLLVADPQLIGENDEPWYFSWIARWDSDRYLRSGFVLANSYTKPDSTIFLGDLFDEGLKSTDEQVERYYNRFKSIFKFDLMSQKFGIKQIFISGDNDVGGEYYGDRNDYLVNRFEKYFGPNVDLIKMNSFIKFLKLDLDYTVSFYKGNKRKKVNELIKESKMKNNEQKGKFTIILNHMSVLRSDLEELNNLNKDSNAGLIIKGDSHLFEIIKYEYSTERVTQYINYKKDKSNYYVMNLNPNKNGKGVQSIYELSIPTCSYRMGVPNMGYGVLTITQNGTAYVSILWLPSRYDCIKLYILYLTIIFCYLIFNLIVKKAFRKISFILTNKIGHFCFLNQNYYILDKN